MKQRQYTELQNEIRKVIDRLSNYLPLQTNKSAREEVAKILQDYDIKPPYMTLREYIKRVSCGVYHTFHFNLEGKEVCINHTQDMLTDELCTLYPLTNKYYVSNDEETKERFGGIDERTHHYLTLAPKDD